MRLRTSALFISLAMLPTLPAADPVAPVAKTIPKTLELHGDRRVDPYFWLREKTNPEVISYLEAENAYTQANMKDTGALQEKLYQEIVARIQEDDTSAAVKRGSWDYFTRVAKGKQYPTWHRRHLPDSKEELLLDANELAKGHAYFQVSVFSVSPNQKLLAYGLDTAGDETLTIYFKDLATGQLLPDRIQNATYGFAWAEDNHTVFYNILDETKRPFKVLRHTLGADPAKDTVVYHETDERFTVGVSKTRSRAYLLLNIASAITTETRYLKADEPSGEFRVLYPRVQDVEYSVAHHGSDWFVLTSAGAKTFKLMRAPVADPSKQTEVIAARADVTLESVDAFANHLTVVERAEGLRKIRVRAFADSEEHYVSLPEPVYTLNPGGDAEYDTNVMRFSYTSLVTPPSTFDYDMNKRTRTLVKQQAVLGTFNQENYTSERIFATAADGTRIPVSLVYRKGLKKDGSNPCLLYGYGSYGISSEPNFSSERLSLLDRGFVYAIAHIRGGSDMGKLWHDAGKMQTKRNTFTDFIAAAELLIKDKYTQPSRLGILGGSAGGLLMGAVVNMRPDLFGAVIAKVPFVDVLSTMMDTTLPLTVGEFEEWGNPADEKAYNYMRSYSPYDNVERQRFPNMLVTGGLNDPRVSYWEPAKWVARLRASKKDSNLLLLKTNMGAGHFGASGRYERFKETAFDYAFLFKALGVKAQ